MLFPFSRQRCSPCAKSTRNRQIWCYTFAVIIEMSTSLNVVFFCFVIFFLNFDQHRAAKFKKKRERSDVVSLFSHRETRLLIHLAFHHQRWWRRTDATGHAWTPSDHQYLESAVQHFYRHVNDQPSMSQQRAGRATESDAQAFLFFNLVDNVSYFVQLQSWSLKEGNKKKTQITKKKKRTMFFVE